MNNIIIMEIRDSRDNGLDKLGSVFLVVELLLADTVKQLTTKGKVGDKIHYHWSRNCLGTSARLTVIHRLEKVNKREDVGVAL